VKCYYANFVSHDEEHKIVQLVDCHSLNYKNVRGNAYNAISFINLLLLVMYEEVMEYEICFYSQDSNITNNNSGWNMTLIAFYI
jgi:hypothetical protein